MSEPAVPVWQYRCRVCYGEANRDGLLKLRALADYFQEAAAHHADNLGVGLNALGEAGMLWVLSRMGIEISRLPEVDEEVVLETWPRRGNSPLFAMREFVLRDSGGGILVRATSAWLLLDGAAFRPRRVSMLPVVLPENQKQAFLYRQLEEVADFQGEACFLDQIRESRIDVNRHLNNAEYFSWLEDCAAENGLSIGRLHRVFINFVHELRLGETVEIGARLNAGSGALNVAGIRMPDGRKIFKAALDFEK
jgi:acyl-ACP thioesterase